MAPRSIVAVSYLFPPDPAIGGIRVGRFLSHLTRRHGWSVQVVTPAQKSMQGSCGLQDDDLPETMTVWRTWNIELFDWVRRVRDGLRGRASGPTNHSPSVKPAAPDREAEASSGRRAFGLLRGISELLAVPDTRIGWIAFAVARALWCVRRAGSDCVLFSSGPPHSAHVATAVVKRLTGRPWVADLRDPWTGNPYNPVLGPLAQRWNSVLEQYCVTRADAVLCNTEASREHLLRSYPELAGHVVTIPNAYDEEDFEGLEPAPIWEFTGRPVFLHAGSMYGKRNPTVFLQALAEFRKEQPDHCPHVIFLGNVSPEFRRQAEVLIDAGDLHGLVTFHAPLPRRQALAAQAAADGLILLGDAEPQRLQIPAKVFEYLRLQKPILSLFAEGAPVEPYLERYAPAYQQAKPDDVESVLQALRAFCRDVRQPGQAPGDIRELSRVHRAETLHDIFELSLTHESRQGVLPMREQAGHWNGSPAGETAEIANGKEEAFPATGDRFDARGERIRRAGIR